MFMPAAQLAVTIASLVAGSICFFLYVYATVVAVKARADALRSGSPVQDQATGAIQPRSLSVEDVSKLADAVARLADSLSRASPALVSLIGALIFFAIAAVGSGALHS
jgi:hypothetical protein